MLARKFRFTTRLFDRVFRRSKRIRIQGFTFLVSPARGVPHFSVVAGKKVSKLAVERNRIRRQIYPIFAEKLRDKIDSNVIFLYNGPAKFNQKESLSSACDALLIQLSNT
jgi:ribonuclease P protein component